MDAPKPETDHPIPFGEDAQPTDPANSSNTCTHLSRVSSDGDLWSNHLIVKRLFPVYQSSDRSSCPSICRSNSERYFLKNLIC